MKKVLLIYVTLIAFAEARQTTYEKNEYKRDWDFQQNWRDNTHQYLHGEMYQDDYPYDQPPLSNVPQDDPQFNCWSE